MSYHASRSQQIGVGRYGGGGRPPSSAPGAAQEIGSQSLPAEIPELLTRERQTALRGSDGINPQQEAGTDLLIGKPTAKGASSP
jgi:hypothetical protein